MAFDDVIIGAGSSGAVLAARLSEDAKRRVPSPIQCSPWNVTMRNTFVCRTRKRRFYPPTYSDLRVAATR